MQYWRESDRCPGLSLEQARDLPPRINERQDKYEGKFLKGDNRRSGSRDLEYLYADSAGYEAGNTVLGRVIGAGDIVNIPSAIVEMVAVNCKEQIVPIAHIIGIDDPN